MSTNDPGQPEYVGSNEPTAPAEGSGGRSGAKVGVIAVAAVAVFAAVGAGAWAVVSFLGAGPSPATAVPADALGYVSLDADPSGAQKIEAIKMLRKFPAIEKELDLGAEDDLRRWVVDQIKEDSDCADLDYDADIEPWIGKKFGFAGVPGEGDEVLPMAVVQVSDEDAARKGIDALVACDGADGEKPGIAFTGDYMVVAETQEQADTMAGDAEEGSLDEDDDYQRWMDEVGDPGIITMYAAPDALQAIMAQPDVASGLSESGGDEQFESMAEEFAGAAGVVRFKDGGVEAAFAGETGVDPEGLMSDGGTDAGVLPDGTAAAFAVSLPEGWADRMMAQIEDSVGADEVEQGVAQLEAETGLAIPEDLETLLGDGFSLAFDSSADLGGLMDGSTDPTTLPIGIRVSGDPGEITPVLDKIKAAIGPDGDMLVTAEGDDVLALGLDQTYVDTLAEEGTLGEQEQFEQAVPEADKASALLYVDFDAGGWLDGLVEQLGAMNPDGSQEAVDNVEPLSSFGISGWTDDEIVHGLVRLTTD